MITPQTPALPPLLRTTALGLVLCVVPMSAQAITWNGSTDTDWFTGSNWAGGVVPISTDNVSISKSGAEAPIIDSAGAVGRDVYVDRLTTAAQLTIQSGGTFNSMYARIGASAAGFMGEATITGVGSLWATINDFAIGLNGTGTLNIEDGGTVSDTVGQLGINADSIGTVTVTGAGSTWTNSSQIIVGKLGTGTLTISNGGTVVAVPTRLARDGGSTGTLNIGAASGQTAVAAGTLTSSALVFGDGTGTLVFNHTDTDYDFDAAISGNGTIRAEAGTTNLTGDSSGFTGNAYVGGTAGATVNLAGGADLGGANGYIGNDASTTGTVTVTGLGSTWTTSNGLRVGNNGQGSLNILNGGQVNSVLTYIGNTVGSVGTGVVDGIGSLWNISDNLFVGVSSNATLTISNGGEVRNNTAKIADALTATATVTVTGPGSKWINSGNLIIANSHNGVGAVGTLLITDGGFVSNVTGLLAEAAGGTGNVTVTGIGSTWASSSYLRVGNFGTGTLTIENGGLITNTDGSIGYSTGSTGTATVAGAGSTWASSGTLYVGNSGDGTLTIADSGAVTNTTGRIGNNSGSTGTATVTGTGSSWTSSSTLFVGLNGSGTLTISDGADVIAMAIFPGYGTGSSGDVTVTGAGSTLSTTTEHMTLASYGTATLTVSDGGAVSNVRSVIGQFAGSTGTATITGIGSTWTASENMRVGDAGTGTLLISDGGLVSNAGSGQIAIQSGSTGSATVTGTGSRWINTGSLYIGSAGAGTLTIADKAQVSSSITRIAQSASSTGILNIGAASGQAGVAAGTLSTPTVAFGSGTGALLFNHLNTVSTPYLFAPDITGSGTITAEGGVTTLTGDLSAFTGTASATNNATLNIGTSYGGDLEVDSGGTLAVNDVITGSVAVNDGGTLKGSGTVGATTVASGGIVAPGNSIGTITVTGDIAFASGSFLDVEMNATTSDLTHATNDANITGGTVRLSKELSTDTITLDTNYTILTADNAVNGTFDAVTLDSLFLTPTLSYDANNVYAAVSRNSTSFLTAAYSFNETEVATALDGATSGAAFIAVALQPTVATAQAAMDRLSGEFHANIKSHVLDEDAAFAHLIIGKMNRTSRHCERSAAIHQTDSATENTSDGSPRRCAPRDDAGGYWATYYGSWQTQKSSTTHGFEADNNGFAFGRTEAINDNTDLGFALAYERADYELVTNQEDSATAKGQTYRAALYATQKHGAWSFKVGSQYNYHDYDTDRHVVFDGYDQRHKASYDAHSFTGYGEAAYTAFETEKLIVQPYAELIYGYGLLTSFKETGDAGLRAGSDGFHEGRSTIGVRMEEKLMFDKTPATLSADLGWIHRIGGANPTGNYSMDGTGKFKSQGTTRTRDELTFSTGLNFSLAQNAALDLTYMTNQSKAGDKHSARVGVAVKF